MRNKFKLIKKIVRRVYNIFGCVRCCCDMQWGWICKANRPAKQASRSAQVSRNISIIIIIIMIIGFHTKEPRWMHTNAVVATVSSELAGCYFWKQTTKPVSLLEKTKTYTNFIRARIKVSDLMRCFCFVIFCVVDQHKIFSLFESNLTVSKQFAVFCLVKFRRWQKADR